MDVVAIPRKRSFTSLTETTYSSSCVSRLTKDDGVAGENFSQELNEVTQNNVKIENSKGIRIGDVIYNIYTPPPPEIFEATKYSNAGTSDQKIEETKIKSNSTESSENLKKISLWNQIKEKIKFKITKKKFIILFTILLLFVAIILLIYFFVIKSSGDFIDDPFIVPRSHWINTPASGNRGLIVPVKRIIVGQTDDSEPCLTKEDCIIKIQAIYVNSSKFKDIPWNYLVGADNRVYEGRGYKFEGEHTMDPASSDFNDIGIGVGFIGNFSDTPAPLQMMEAFKKFIIELIKNDKLNMTYKIFFQEHLVHKNIKAVKLEEALEDGMGEKFYKVKKFYPRKEWGAIDSCKPLTPMSAPTWRVILHHSGENTWQCENYLNCTDELRMFQRNTMSERDCETFDTFYNFAIGGVGDYSIVMEARGFDKVGAHTRNYNKGSLGIGLIGQYDHDVPGEAMMNALRDFLEDAVAIGKLTEDYELNVKQDFDFASSPGVNVINIVKNWPHYKKFEQTSNRTSL